MNPPSPEDVVDLLTRAGDGDPTAAEALLPQVYDALRVLAASHMAREPAGHTLRPTALVNEAYLRLVGDRETGWAGRGQSLPRRRRPCGGFWSSGPGATGVSSESEFGPDDPRSREARDDLAALLVIGYRSPRARARGGTQVTGPQRRPPARSPCGGRAGGDQSTL